MGITWITPEEINPGSDDDWIECDLSGSVAVGTTGVIIHQYQSSGSVEVGWRDADSTDNRIATQYGNPAHTWFACGVNAAYKIDLYRGGTGVKFWLVGYLDSDAYFHVNAPEVSPAGTGSWEEIDLEGATFTPSGTAIGAFIEVVCATDDYDYGIQMDGSGDNRITGYDIRFHGGAVIGLAVEKFEGQIQNAAVEFWLNGYMTAGATFNLNATDLSLGGADSWTDLTALPAGGTGGFIEVISTSTNHLFGLRKDDTAEALIGNAAGYRHTFGMVEADATRIIEGNINNTAVDFFLVGYSTAAAGGETHQLAGVISIASMLSGDINVKRSLLGAVNGTTALSALLQRTSRVTGSCDGVSSLSGSLNIKRVFAGAIEAVSSFVGSLTLKVIASLGGIINAVSTFDGSTISIKKRMIGSMASAAVLSGNVTLTKGVTGLIEAVSSFAGSTEIKKAFVGTINVQSGFVGNIRVERSIAGIIEAVSALSGSLTFKGEAVWVHLDGIIFYTE